ncbi:hypothetical protein O5O45_22925 [Hahella aquimaris]|uniref:hypothetical protein n=1 Tax=Hahella sp. HNIBRBA332 TaxID=3015983 RepID=UPI00273B6E3B|nr:hypothetical protein [Hahella sp. HNIBRBA332]WLQ12585.1 hypothetical protein O5O45_22925 [Hahella sp. HNIBRBA332]
MTLNFRAVILGTVFDIGGSFIAFNIVSGFYLAMMHAGGASKEDLEALIGNPSDAFELMAILMGVGIAFDGLAGYLTAKMAGFLEYWHVLAMWGLLTVLQLALSSGVGEGDAVSLPSYVVVVGYVGGLIAAFTGAYLFKKSKRRSP